MKTEQEKRALIAAYAKDAIMVQDACNLSGVLHSWSRHAHEMMTDCEMGTIGFRTHPASKLFADKVSDLCGRPNFTDYDKSTDACEELVKAVLAEENANAM